MLNKILIFLTLGLISSLTFGQTRFGQDIEINPYGGFFFGGRLSVSEGRLNYKDVGNYGGTISMNIRGPMRAELTWNSVNSRLVLEKYGTGLDNELFDMTINYIHVGVTWTAKSGKVQPYGLFSSGVVIFDPDSRKYSSEWLWSFSLGGGLKYYFNRSLGLRLQARLNVPVYFYGLYIHGGSGGLGYGVSGGSAVAQGDVSAGLIIALPR